MYSYVLVWCFSHDPWVICTLFLASYSYSYSYSYGYGYGYGYGYRYGYGYSYIVRNVTSYRYKL